MADKRPDKPSSGTLDLFGEPARSAPPSPPRGEPDATAQRGSTGAGPHATAAPQQSTAYASPATPVEGPRTYRVAEIVRLAGRALEARFADVWVEGEISGYRPQQSGHGYFNLKDADAVLPAVMFRSALGRLRFRLADGLTVRARGRLSIYEASGKFQLYVEAMEPVGLGALQLAFEQLKRKLEAEGLFAAPRKRALPFLPRRIGVATSASGAVIRDIIRVAGRRGPARILLAPCAVQGESAPDDIVRALAALQQIPDVELIIVGRGGGSFEDLAAFNDERVARAIAACRVPVISAVGHEVDFTIADFVADRRAATPSQAAELAVPVHAELVASVSDLRRRLFRAVRRIVFDQRLRLDGDVAELCALARRAVSERRRALADLHAVVARQHPRARLEGDRGQLAALRHRLERPLAERIAQGRRTLEPLDRRLHAAMQQRIGDGRRLTEALPVRLVTAMHKRAVDRRRELEGLCRTLDALSPLKVLDRGYGLVLDRAGHVVTSPASLNPGDRVTLRFAGGHARATIDEVEPDAGHRGKR